MAQKSIKEAFWDRVTKTETCWLWIGPTMPFGYGHCYINRVRKYAHRYSYEVHKGAIEPGMQVNHTCDNPKCVNPDHLYQGTQKDNAADKTIRERASRLNGSQVLEIREKYKTGNYTSRQLGREYGVTKTQILWIIHYKSWKHIA